MLTNTHAVPACRRREGIRQLHDRVDAEVSIRDGMTTTRWAWDLACKLRKSSPRHYCTFENSDRVINYWADERYM